MAPRRAGVRKGRGKGKRRAAVNPIERHLLTEDSFEILGEGD